jgi:hypothetical protein
VARSDTRNEPGEELSEADRHSDRATIYLRTKASYITRGRTEVSRIYTTEHAHTDNYCQYTLYYLAGHPFQPSTPAIEQFIGTVVGYNVNHTLKNVALIVLLASVQDTVHAKLPDDPIIRYMQHVTDTKPGMPSTQV